MGPSGLGLTQRNTNTRFAGFGTQIRYFLAIEQDLWDNSWRHRNLQSGCRPSPQQESRFHGNLSVGRPGLDECPVNPHLGQNSFAERAEVQVQRKACTRPTEGQHRENVLFRFSW
jgi:hypothetical protein